MQWESVLYNRRQTFVWQDRVPAECLIDGIINQLHNYCPSKQKKVPYEIEVHDWRNPTLRKRIFANSWCNSNTLTDRRNPQLLAPYLFMFKKRDLPGADAAYSYGAELEIGLAAMFLTLTAASLDLDTGFCGCLHDPNYVLGVGVGYAAPDRSLYWNPLLERMVPAPGIPLEEHKPSQSSYIKRFDQSLVPVPAPGELELA